MEHQFKFIIDGHLDLALNALEWNRNLKEPVALIREREAGMSDKLDRGLGVVSLPDLRKARIGLVVATQIARVVKKGNPLSGWHSPEQAWAQSQGQLAWYQAMEEQGEMVQIADSASLEKHLKLWADQTIEDHVKPVGYMLSLEGADSLVELSYLEKAYRNGLRAVGPAHYGPGRYANGTGSTGPLNHKGIALLKEMDNLNMILDVTHLTDEAFWQALHLFKGTIWASHHNCRSLVTHQRQLSDDQIKALIEREAVIGGALDVWMLTNGWVRGSSDPRKDGVPIAALIDHFDHICQLAGNSNHIALGSDLDGMFGKEQSPYDLETVADLGCMEVLLQRRGYNREDTNKILHGNWLRIIRNAWAV